MASLKLNVPALAQEKSMCCWHTSAVMIWRYWQQVTGRQGPMNTIVPVYEANTGLTANAFVVLGEHADLKALASQINYSNANIYALLKQCGPLWCAGYWYGPGHVIVLTGVEEGMIFLNDPDGGVKKTATVAWFNARLAKIDGSVRYEDPGKYLRKG